MSKRVFGERPHFMFGVGVQHIEPLFFCFQEGEVSPWLRPTWLRHRGAIGGRTADAVLAHPPRPAAPLAVL
ncbi:hypothetical protein KAU04_01500, partial [bacterium]|nr:hypothetical protein [bacterium]